MTPSTTERSKLRKALVAFHNANAGNFNSLAHALGLTDIAYKSDGISKHINRCTMSQLRSMVDISIRNGHINPITLEPNKTKEQQMASTTPEVETTTAPIPSEDIKVNASFVAPLDSMLAAATDGKITSITSVVNMVTRLNKERKELTSLVETLKRKAAAAPMVIAPSGPVGGGSVGIPTGKVVFAKAADFFLRPDGSKEPTLDFDIPYFEWDGPHPEVPEVDPHYVFRLEHLIPFLYALVLNKNTWVHGNTGTGKTTFVEQVAARLGWPVSRVNLDNDIERADFLGTTQLIATPSGTESKFVEGILPRSMQKPCIFLIDEMDFGKSGIMYVLQRALEAKGLLLTEDAGRLVVPDPYFRMVATANTRGQGDEMGCYPGARVQSNALLDRFTVWIHIDYMTMEEEQRLLANKYPHIATKTVKQMTLFAKEIRKAFINRELLQTISPRSLMSICEAYGFYTMTVPEDVSLSLAIESSYIERATDDTKAKVLEIANRTFDVKVAER